MNGKKWVVWRGWYSHEWHVWPYAGPVRTDRVFCTWREAYDYAYRMAGGLVDRIPRVDP